MLHEMDFLIHKTLVIIVSYKKLSSVVIFPRIEMVLNKFLKKSKYLQTSREKNQWQNLEEAKQYGICKEHI